MADPLANQKATLHALFTALNAKDLDGIIAVRTPECLHIVTPESMPGETRTNEQHHAWAQKTMDMMGGQFFTDGTKTAEVLEFMDSKYTSEFHAKMQAFGAEQQKMKSVEPEHMVRARAMPY
ncbi:hypothetical protein LTR53_007153 [Teratosphaeriaceae sp. CCFEE 6253]|nr:hypothetical protein LTR53_007153 [Teratosphaeriaceae sp. CCFEE 6253]